MGYTPAFMEEMTPTKRRALVYAIASKQGNAREISERFGLPIPWLRSFVETNKQELAEVREAIEREPENDDEVTPAELANLWISNKAERIARYQTIAELLYAELIDNVNDSTNLREFRSYLAAVANELGQLLHRGSGEAGMGDTVSYEVEGVDLNQLR